ncbi:MAG: DNA-directed RNA polymerase subunit omega [Bacteroidales bacterium]|jgi:DNA-directed RNA polymerase subunit K/omega|nr:DNA-directed RNA polymerase subunit omega [Bacteroidales bacterium]MBR5107486.1 DNA-directed RNA polymerase subunit omega [Bacteroidales bacterium]
MDANSKKKVPGNTITRDIRTLAAPTGNIYESVVILYKRANQIAAAEKKELTKKLEDFRNDRDTMEEVFENKEQIEISKYYERQPKPDLVAISEFENGELYYRRAQSANPIDINGEE